MSSDFIALAALGSAQRANELVSQTIQERITGNNNKKYKVIAGAIRNTGGTWALINDTEHEPINIESVSADTSKIIINYGFTAKKVGSLVCVPDETFVLHGFNFGASVGLNLSHITPRISKTIGGYISYTGSAWDITNTRGIKSAVWTAETSTLLITHDSMYHDNTNAYNVQISTRDGALIACLGSVGLTTFAVQFRDYAGALITTLTTDMKFYVTRMTTGDIDPAKLDIAGANIWIYGIMEVNDVTPSGGYLYNAGIEYEPWSQGVNTSFGTGTTSISKEVNYLSMQAIMTSSGVKNIGYSTDNKIDLSTISTLYIDMDVTVNDAAANCLVGLDPNSRTDVNNYYSDLIVRTSNSNTGRRTHTINVSAMNDSRYIKFICGASGTGSSSTVKVYSVRGE